MIAAVARFLRNSVGEILARLLTFEREFGAIFKMPADANERLRRLQLGVMLVFMAIQQRRKRQQIVRKHLFWVREIFKNRPQFGTFHTLVQELRLHDREFFYR